MTAIAVLATSVAPATLLCEQTIRAASTGPDEGLVTAFPYARTYADYREAWHWWFVHTAGIGHDYVKKTLRMGGPDADLFRRMGFRLDGNTLHCPTFDRAMEVFRDAHVAPGFVYVDPSNAEAAPIFRPIWAVAPNGRVVHDSDRVTPDMMGPMVLADLYPLSTQRLKHDLNHNLGLLRFPEYLRALQTLQRRYASTSPLSRGDKDQRFAWFLEGFAYIPEANRERMLTLLGAPFTRENAAPTLTDVVHADRDKGDETIRREARALLDGYVPLMNLCGGGARDWDRLWHEDWITECIPSIAQRLQFALTRQALHRGNREVPDVRLELARLKTALFYSIGLTPEIFLEGMSSSRVAEAHAVYRYFVTSGIADRVTWSGTNGPTMMSIRFPTLRASGNDADSRAREVARLRETYDIGAAQIGASTATVREHLRRQGSVLPSSSSFEVVAAHAILSLPMARIRQMLAYARGRHPRADVLEHLARGSVGETLDLRNAQQREYLDLIDSLIYLRQVGADSLVESRIAEIRQYVQGWP